MDTKANFDEGEAFYAQYSAKKQKKKSMAAKEKSIADNLTSTRMECAHQRKKTFLGLPKEI